MVAKFFIMLGGTLSRWYLVRVSSPGTRCLKDFITFLISFVVIISASFLRSVFFNGNGLSIWYFC